MPSRTLNAIFLVAIGALSTGATAQNTYRCGDSYSQTPCPGGVIVQTADQRSPAQKSESDSVIKRDAKTADVMEKARLQQEAKDLAANTPPPKPATPASASKASANLTKKKNARKVSVAKAPIDKKKKPVKPSSKKTTKSKA